MTYFYSDTRTEQFFPNNRVSRASWNAKWCNSRPSDYCIFGKRQFFSRSLARLRYEYNKKPMSWVPLLDHRNQWLQVYLGNELTWVTGVATQGKQGKRKAWVKKFMLRYGELEYECSIKRAMGISTPRWVK